MSVMTKTKYEDLLKGRQRLEQARRYLEMTEIDSSRTEARQMLSQASGLIAKVIDDLDVDIRFERRMKELYRREP